MPAADAGGAVPASLFCRTSAGGSSGMTRPSRGPPRGRPPAGPAHRDRRAGQARRPPGPDRAARLRLRDHRAGGRHGLHVQEAVPDGGRAGRAGGDRRGQPRPAVPVRPGCTAPRSARSPPGGTGYGRAIFAALMTIFIVIRHTRTDEEAGRLELVGSAAVGRQAALAAALLTAVPASLAIIRAAGPRAAVRRTAVVRLGRARAGDRRAAGWRSPGSPRWRPS